MIVIPWGTLLTIPAFILTLQALSQIESHQGGWATAASCAILLWVLALKPTIVRKKSEGQ